MIFLGDIHGNYHKAFALAKQNPSETIIQLGDFGIGFKTFPKFPKNLKFIRGNHDNPEICKSHPNYLGDFGIYENFIFFVSGANSIDKHFRTPNVDWWENEELSISQTNNILANWKQLSQSIITIISHDIPQSWAHNIFGISETSHTRNFLQILLEIHPPQIWIAGHHHKQISQKINQTQLYILGENQHMQINL